MNDKIKGQGKFNKKTRCPWCGNVLINKTSFLMKVDFGTKRCKVCGGYSEPEDKLTDILYNGEKLYLLLLFFASYKKIFYLIIYLAFFVISSIAYSFFYKYVPYKRTKGYQEKGRIMPSDWSLKEQVILYAHIKWNCSKWHIFKFWNSKLLIIIAVDKNNQPISHPICVRIRKCKTGYELTKIMRAVEFNNKECRRFLVYWGDELVGEGSVVLKFYL